jgi:hypothetical protein
VRARHGDLEIERWKLAGAIESSDGAGAGASAAGEDLVLLSIQRGSRVNPMHAGLALEPGDVVAVAIYAAEHAAAHERLRRLGFVPAPEPDGD